MAWIAKRRGEIPDPEYVVGPDGRPTPESLASIERAALAGHVEAMANHGATLFQRGEHAEAVRFWERAWKAGNAAAGFNLGTHYVMSGEADRAEDVWQRSAALGDVDAVVGSFVSRSNEAITRPPPDGLSLCSAPESPSR